MVFRVTPEPEVHLPRPQLPYKCPGILGAWLFPEMLGGAGPWASDDAGEPLWVPGEMLVVREAEPEMSSPGRPSTTLGIDPARLPQGEGCGQGRLQPGIGTTGGGHCLPRVQPGPPHPTPSSDQNWTAQPGSLRALLSSQDFQHLLGSCLLSHGPSPQPGWGWGASCREVSGAG